MRVGRLGSLLVAAALALPESVLAQSGGTPPAASDPARIPTRNAAAARQGQDGNFNGLGRGDGTRIGPKTVQPTYGPNGPGTPERNERTWHQPREIWARNSDPVVAERPDAPGKFYDVRPNGERGTLNPQRAQEALDRQRYYEQNPSVTVYDWQTPEARVGVLDGRIGQDYNRDTQNGATARGCVLCADANAKAQAGFTRDSLQVSASAEAGAYLAKVDGQFDAVARGDVGSIGVSGQGSAFVGARARALGTVEANINRVTANGRVDAFAGARAEGQLTGQAGLNNVGTVKGTVIGEVQAGIGVSAEGYLHFDRTTWTFKVGGRASAALGIGAGVGFQTEISVKPAVEAISAGARQVGGWVSRNVGRLCFWCKQPPPVTPTLPVQQQINTGTQVSLRAPTGPAVMAQTRGQQNAQGGGKSDEAEAAGMARD